MAKKRLNIKPKFKNSEWEIVSDDISQQGYRDDSPYRDRKSIDIHTDSGLIDMSETGIPILANGRFLPPYSGMHQFEPGVVKEKRVMQDGGRTPIKIELAKPNLLTAQSHENCVSCEEWSKLIKKPGGVSELEIEAFNKKYPQGLPSSMYYTDEVDFNPTLPAPDWFSRPLKNSERPISKEDIGKRDYFDKKTGKFLGTYQDGGKISLDEFRPKFANSNEAIQQQMLQQKPMVKNLPEVEITGESNWKTKLARERNSNIYASGKADYLPVESLMLPTSLPFRATSNLGKAGVFAAEVVNPLGGFRGLKPKNIASSVEDVIDVPNQATMSSRQWQQVPIEETHINTNHNTYRGSDLDVERYNNITENINTTYIDPSLQEFHNSIRDRVLNTYNNLPSDEFGFTIYSPSRKQLLKKNIRDSSIIDAIKNPKKTSAILQYEYERGALNPKSLYYNHYMDILPGDKIGGHGLFGDAEKGFKGAMNKSAEVNPGRMFGEANLSSDSFPLLLAQLRRKAKDVNITHTGDFVPLNNHGNKSKSLLTAAKNPQEGQESILKHVNEHIDRLNKEVGSKIPYAKIINRKVHIPYILAEKKGATLTDKLQRNKTVGLLGTGAATVAGIKPAFDYANTYNQEKFEKDYNEYIKNKPLQNWEQYPLQQKKSGGKINTNWEILPDNEWELV